MRIVVFGATGKAGQLLVRKALEDGYEVVAYARNPSKLAMTSEHLEVIRGELSDQASIERAIDGVDAVVSLLGPHGRKRTKPLTLGMRNIIASMNSRGIRRLIIISTASVKDPNDRPDIRFKLLVSIVRLLIRPAYEEIISVAEVVRNSDLDWTLVRLSLLNNKPATGKVRAGYLGRGGVGIGITREDMVAFMLSRIGDAKYLRQSPAISN